MTRKRLMLWCFSILTAAGLWSQQPQEPSLSPDSEQEAYKIGVEVNMVSVPVTVRRPEGGFIKGIPQSAFRLYEDQEPQEIVFFAQEALPTRIAIVLDSSGSVRSEWGTIKHSTRKFVEQLKPEDQFSLVSFADDIRLKMDWGRRTDRIEAVMTSIYCKGNTKLWDAIWVVCKDVFKGIQEKKAVIIMSDGLDNESMVSYSEALKTAVQSEAAIYVVSKTEAVRQMIMYEEAKRGYYDNISHEVFVQADLALRRLAYETGGRVLYPNNFGQLDNVYAEVDEELRSQYTVGYISSNSAKDGTYRRIDVRVDTQGAAANVSSRPGYYAPDERDFSQPGRRP